MTKQQKSLLSGASAIIILFGLFFGIRIWRLSVIENKIENGQLAGGFFSEQISFAGKNYLVPPQDIYEAGSTLLPITNPVFDSVTAADLYLADDVYGIDIEFAGEHRFYSYQILNWHEVVQDSFGEINLLITHSDLCISPAVYQTGEIFKNSGLIYNNNQLLTDADTESLWSQIRGTAIVGERVGETLATYPFTVMKWSEFRDTYPNAKALSRETGYSFDYTAHPYANYDTAKIVYFPNNTQIVGLADKAPIRGYVLDNGYLMVSDISMALIWAWNGLTQNNQGVSVFYDIRNNESHVYNSNVFDKTLTFEFDIENEVFVDNQAGSTWNIDGLAITGALEGTQLDVYAFSTPMFAMCWAGVYPDTLVTTKSSSIGGGLLGSNEIQEETQNESQTQ